MFKHFHSTIFLLLFLAVFFVNTFILKQPILGGILLIIYLGHFGGQFGKAIAPSEQEHTQWWLGVWTLLSIVAIVGSIAYYIASVPAAVFQSIVLVTPAIILWTKKHTASPFNIFHHLRSLWHEHRHNVSSSVWTASAIVLVFLITLFQYFRTHPILDAVRTPWDRIDVSTLILFAIAALLVVTLLYRGRERSISISLFIFLIGTIILFATIVYPIGYGFDSFIHKATESHLAEFGTISPKPFYYIGQYALVLFFSHAFSLPIDLVDTYLLPILTMILLPLAWYAAAIHIVKKPRHALFTLIGIFLLPLESFIVTTPQGLANLWVLLVILASVPFLVESEKLHRVTSALGVVATILIHPIAGIPLFFFSLLVWFHARRFFFWGTAIVSAFGLPVLFLMRTIINHEPWNLHFDKLSPSAIFAAMNLDVLFQNRFTPLLDLVYLYGKNAFLLVLLISGIIFWMYRRDLSNRIRIVWVMVIALFINYLLLSTLIDFSFLIDYERSNYAERLLPLITFFLSPLIILAFGHVSINIRTRPVILKISLLILMSIIATSTFYLTYPRRDAYTTNRGFNVSQADVDAVYLIEQWAEGKPYIVLANQSVSAAAIKHIGFRYINNQFIYPIPTGTPFYQLFLDMNTSPSREIITRAREEFQTLCDASPCDIEAKKIQTVFYVVNTYWWESARIIETAKSIADDWKSVGGSVYVFRFGE